VIVIGGGSTGVGVARDAAMRGLKTAILEKDDFGAGTSSRSSRISGGAIRYVQMLDFKLVRKSAKEAKILRRIAPHLIHPLNFVVPIYRNGPFSKLEFRIAVFIYRFFGNSGEIISAQRTKELEPNLSAEGLLGAALIPEGQFPFCERLYLDNVLSAVLHRAVACNHVLVEDFLKSGSTVTGVKVRDRLSGEVFDVRGKVTVDCAGPWLNQLSTKIRPDSAAVVRPAKGTQLVTERISNNAIMMFGNDGRYVFTSPTWGLSIVGNTDTDVSEDLDTIRGTREDVDYILKQFENNGLPVHENQILYVMSGARPLYPEAGKTEGTTVSRYWKIFDHAAEGIDGIVSVIGGNIGPFRGRAEETIDLVCKKLGNNNPCVTTEPLPSALDLLSEAFKTKVTTISSQSGLNPDQILHLCHLYGNRFEGVLREAHENPSLKQPICQHNLDVRAEIVYSAKYEMTMTLNDFMFDRSCIAWSRCEGLDGVKDVAELLGEELNWDERRITAEIDAFNKKIELRHQCLKEVVPAQFKNKLEIASA